MADVKFVEGIRVFAPNPKAPSFVKGNIKIDKVALMRWLEDQSEIINVDIKESQKGAWYLSVNEYVKPSEPKIVKPNEPDGLPF